GANRYEDWGRSSRHSSSLSTASTPAERSSTAAAASVSYELPETETVAAVCYRTWFGAAPACPDHMPRSDDATPRDHARDTVGERVGQECHVARRLDLAVPNFGVRLLIMNPEVHPPSV